MGRNVPLHIYIQEELVSNNTELNRTLKVSTPI